MRKLLLSLFAVCLFGIAPLVRGVDWGDVEIYASWEITTDFGTGDSGKSQSAYIAIGNKRRLVPENGYPLPAPGSFNSLTLYVFPEEKQYSRVANKVTLDLNKPSSFETEWLLNFTTQSGQPANVTFKCLSNQIPNLENLTLRLLTVGGAEKPIKVQEGETTTVMVPSEDGPNTLMATYEVPLVDGVEYALNLAPGWNLVGIPLLEVTDDGGLFHHTVLYLDSVITRISELKQGAAYWVYNNANSVATVTLKGTAFIGEKSTLADDLTAGWNYVSLAGTVTDATTKEFAPAESPSNPIWRWDASVQSFVPDSVLELGVGYVIKN